MEVLATVVVALFSADVPLVFGEAVVNTAVSNYNQSTSLFSEVHTFAIKQLRQLLMPRSLYDAYTTDPSLTSE